MPFTPAHAAAVLPFFRVSRPAGGGAVPAARVFGSMAPDAHYYVPLPLDRGLSHSLAGVVTADLAVGLVLFVAWQGLLARGVLAVAPDGLRRRLGPRRPAGLRYHLGGVVPVALVAVSLVVGSLTHVLWDAFTHHGTWATALVPWLEGTAGPLPRYRWAQFASGVVGGAILAVAAVRWWRSAGRDHGGP